MQGVKTCLLQNIGKYIVHVIHAGGGDAGHEFGRGNSAVREDLAGMGGVLELNYLVGAAEDDLVLANDGAAADCGNTYLGLAAGLAHALALIDILGLIWQTLGHGVGQHDGGAAGGVHFISVVALNYFHIIAIAQNGGDLFKQIGKQIYSKRHVSAAENRDLF